MKRNLKNLILLSMLALSACTVAVHDPEAFKAQAHHREKTYEVPLPKFYACYMRGARLSPPLETLLTDEEGYFGSPGLWEFVMTKKGNKTLARYSNVGDYWTKFGERIFERAEMCGKE
ncbi:MAG: hypothetical protein WBK55_06385 [Alphaproteobacteria bacterium]